VQIKSCTITLTDYVNCTLFGVDNVLNRGPEAAMSLVETKMVNAAGRMADLLGTDIFLDGQGTNSSSIALDGLDASIDDGSNYQSYGGVTRTDISATASTGINAYVVNAQGVLTLAAVQTAYGQAWFGREHVDLLIMPQPVWDILWNKIQPQQRFREESSDVAKIGFQSMRFNGASATVDQLCPAGFLWGLNTKFIQFWITTMPKYQSTRLPRTATCDGKPALMDSDAAMQTRRNPIGDRDRLSERASLADDAIVGSHGNLNHESMAEMTIPSRQIANVTKTLVLRAGKRLNEFFLGLFGNTGCQGWMAAQAA